MDGERILVVADDVFDSPPEDILLWTADLLTGARRVHVIAPVIGSRVEWATDADAPLSAANERLREVLSHAKFNSVDATGEVVRDSPLNAIKIALMDHTYDRIIVGIRERTNWQEKDLVSKIQAATRVPVHAVVVPTSRS